MVVDASAPPSSPQKNLPAARLPPKKTPVSFQLQKRSPALLPFKQKRLRFHTLSGHRHPFVSTKTTVGRPLRFSKKNGFVSIQKRVSRTLGFNRKAVYS